MYVSEELKLLFTMMSPLFMFGFPVKEIERSHISFVVMKYVNWELKLCPHYSLTKNKPTFLDTLIDVYFHIYPISASQVKL